MDAFALLGFDPRPWLDADEIQRRTPPEGRVDGRGFAAEASESFERARRILIDPRSRLRYLFELKFPDAKITDGPAPLPNALAQCFEEATMLEEKLNAFLARKKASSSPLARALLAREAMAFHAEAETWLARLAEHEGEWLTALQEWDIRWRENDPTAHSREVLEMFTHAFAYLGRWRDTTRERAFLLLEA